MKKQIAILPGDGVGPEIITEGVLVLKAVAKKFGHEFSFDRGLIGAAAMDKTGDPLPAETIEQCMRSDAILFGAIGSPKYDANPSAKIRPEQGLLKLRRLLGLYANIRPIYVFPSITKSPLKPEITKDVDFVIVRELTGGMYFGQPRGRDKEKAYETNIYTKAEILRVTKIAFDIASARGQLRHSGKRSASRIDSGVANTPQNDRPKVTLVDKANVLETSRLWREVVQEYATNFPDIQVDYMFVDNAAMQIIKRPKEFDVILTDNMFGDILTDEASVIAGSIGLLPSASLGEKTSLYEPIHGSFPKAAGLNTANPVGTILSTAMMLGSSFQMVEESQAVFTAVKKTIASGYGTKDIFEGNALGTREFTQEILKNI